MDGASAAAIAQFVLHHTIIPNTVNQRGDLHDDLTTPHRGPNSLLIASKQAYNLLVADHPEISSILGGPPTHTILTSMYLYGVLRSQCPPIPAHRALPQYTTVHRSTEVEVAPFPLWMSLWPPSLARLATRKLHSSDSGLSSLLSHLIQVLIQTLSFSFPFLFLSFPFPLHFPSILFLIIPIFEEHNPATNIRYRSRPANVPLKLHLIRSERPAAVLGPR